MMTSFEEWLQKSGKGLLIYGGRGELACRIWLLQPIDIPISIGLFKVDDVPILGLRFPRIENLPIEEDKFEEYYESLLVVEGNVKKNSKINLFI
jgi:hypothetical protein